MLHLSNPNSVISARSRNQQTVCKPLPHTQPRKRLCDVTPEHTEEFANAQPHAQLYKPLVESIANTKSTPLRNYRGYSTQHDPYSQNRVSTLKNQEFQGSPHSSNSSHIALQEYHILLEEAREIRYSGRNLPFIFFQNQIRELIKRCPISHRKMDLLRASCQEGAREAISALVPPVPGWDIDTQITRALEGLRLRYGCCSFLAELLVRQIRSGAKLPRMDAGTLEKLISDLNDCELYARAHQQMHSLDSNFIVDVGERPLTTLRSSTHISYMITLAARSNHHSTLSNNSLTESYRLLKQLLQSDFCALLTEERRIDLRNGLKYITQMSKQKREIRRQQRL